MKFQFSEKKVKLPGNVHAYAEKKVMKLARYFEEDAEALIVFSVEKNRNNVELTVRGASHLFRAHESTSDMFASIDAAVGTIEGQIRKNKTRLARRLRQDAFSRTVEATSFAAEEPEDKMEIVRVKSFRMEPMSREEAVLQMNLLGHNFFAFRDADNDDCFAVVYRRNDGNLGTHQTFQSAVKARRAAEERLHDPIIQEYIYTLTDERREEFQRYLRGEYACG